VASTPQKHPAANVAFSMGMMAPCKAAVSGRFIR
jgi:hypothetical protein